MGPITYSGARPHLLQFFDPHGRRVLDVGCGGGGLGRYLTEAGASALVGVEPLPAAASQAAASYDEVLCSTVERLLTEQRLGTRQFDLILLADVLEHLVDPWETLRLLVDRHLAPKGQVFISVPNVANVAVIRQLILRRDWRYDDSGLFDRTHLRWFGARSTRQMIDQANLDVIGWGGRIRFGLGPIRIDRLSLDVSRTPALAIFQFHCLASSR